MIHRLLPPEGHGSWGLSYILLWMALLAAGLLVTVFGLATRRWKAVFAGLLLIFVVVADVSTLEWQYPKDSIGMPLARRPL